MTDSNPHSLTNNSCLSKRSEKSAVTGFPAKRWHPIDMRATVGGMPAQALPVDWNEVRTVARAVGVREAARRLSEGQDPESIRRFTESVMKRSQREGWLADRHHAVATLSTQKRDDIRTNAIITLGGDPSAMSAMDALDHRQHGKPSREYAARAARNGLKRLAEASDERPEVMTDPENVGALVGLTKVANTVHGWSGSAQPATIRLELLARGAGACREIDGQVIDVESVADGDDEG